MTYSAVATVLHTNDPSNAAFETAISFARKHDVHLHVLCRGMDHSETGYYYAGAQAFVIQQNFELAQASWQKSFRPSLRPVYKERI